MTKLYYIYIRIEFRLHIPELTLYILIIPFISPKNITDETNNFHMLMF